MLARSALCSTLGVPLVVLWYGIPYSIDAVGVYDHMVPTGLYAYLHCQFALTSTSMGQGDLEAPLLWRKLGVISLGVGRRPVTLTRARGRAELGVGGGAGPPPPRSALCTVGLTVQGGSQPPIAPALSLLRRRARAACVLARLLACPLHPVSACCRCSPSKGWRRGWGLCYHLHVPQSIPTAADHRSTAMREARQCPTDAYRARLYIGHDAAGVRLPDARVDAAITAALESYGIAGATQYAATGRWDGATEPTTVLEYLSADCGRLAALQTAQDVAQYIAGCLEQDCVLLVFDTPTAVLVDSDGRTTTLEP